MLGCSPLTGLSATKRNVVRMLADAPILHLATHGIVCNPEFKLGAVLLAPSSGDDGILHASELPALRVGARLVVLSACQTGQGQVSAEGLLGLSRALLLAGVPASVLSLWPVDDEFTEEFMVHLYSMMIGGECVQEQCN